MSRLRIIRNLKHAHSPAEIIALLTQNIECVNVAALTHTMDVISQLPPDTQVAISRALVAPSELREKYHVLRAVAVCHLPFITDTLIQYDEKDGNEVFAAYYDEYDIDLLMKKLPDHRPTWEQVWMLLPPELTRLLQNRGMY